LSTGRRWWLARDYVAQMWLVDHEEEEERSSWANLVAGPSINTNAPSIQDYIVPAPRDYTDCGSQAHLPTTQNNTMHEDTQICINAGDYEGAEILLTDEETERYTAMLEDDDLIEHTMDAAYECISDCDCVFETSLFKKMAAQGFNLICVHEALSRLQEAGVVYEENGVFIATN
jgi:hypothetical protein